MRYPQRFFGPYHIPNVAGLYIVGYCSGSKRGSYPRSRRFESCPYNQSSPNAYAVVSSTPLRRQHAGLAKLVHATVSKSVFLQVRVLYPAPILYSSIAQLVEHAAVNRRVVGSSPT